MRFTASFKYFSLESVPIPDRPNFWATTTVVAPPQNGSSTVAFVGPISMPRVSHVHVRSHWFGIRLAQGTPHLAQTPPLDVDDKMQVLSSASGNMA